MKDLQIERVCEILNRAMEYELAGVVRYTHYSLMVSGPYRLPIVQFMKEQGLADGADVGPPLLLDGRRREPAQPPRGPSSRPRGARGRR